MRFYAVPNDLIGGWDVSAWDKPVSEHVWENDEFTVGSYLSKLWAERVARALNLYYEAGYERTE